MEQEKMTGSGKPDLQTVEFYHDMGWMPDWAYYQLNGKSAQENYIDQKRKMQKETMEKLEQRRAAKDDDFQVNIKSEVKVKK